MTTFLIFIAAAIIGTIAGKRYVKYREERDYDHLIQQLAIYHKVKREQDRVHAEG